MNFFHNNIGDEINLTAEHNQNKVESAAIKKGVDFVFEKNPELASIGSQEQYSQYLDVVFPQSKIKNILYHEGNEGIEKFDNTKYNKKLGRDELKMRYGLGHYFTSDIEYASGFGEQMYSVLLKMTSPKSVKIGVGDNSYRNVANIQQADLDQLKKDGYDSIIGVADESIDDRSVYPDEYVVFEPEQVRILGSEEDIEEFKKFTENC